MTSLSRREFLAAAAGLGATALEVEFVCIPRPVERSVSSDGGPLRYRVLHRAKLWNENEHPALEQRIMEGDARFST